MCNWTQYIFYKLVSLNNLNILVLSRYRVIEQVPHPSSLSGWGSPAPWCHLASTNRRHRQQHGLTCLLICLGTHSIKDSVSSLTPTRSGWMRPSTIVKKLCPKNMDSSNTINNGERQNSEYHSSSEKEFFFIIPPLLVN